jgi:hypothetical protein
MNNGPTADELRTVLDKYVEGATWAVAMAAVGRKEKTAFSWIQKSQHAERLKQLTSPFFLKWNSDDGDDPDDKPDWFHVHLKAAGRARRTIIYETVLVNQAIHGIEEIIRDGTGRIVFQEDPAKIGFDDDMLTMIYGSTDRLLRDENNLPVPAVRVTQLPATLRQAIIRGLMPGVYGDHQTVDVNTQSRVIVQHQFLKRPSAPSPRPIEQAAEPLALPAPEPAKVESDLVRELRERLKAGVKNPHPDPKLAPVPIMGRATGDKPDNVSGFPTDVPPTPDVRDHPRAYQVPKPTPAPAPTPNYGRPQQIDRPGYGTRGGDVPPGGMRVR